MRWTVFILAPVLALAGVSAFAAETPQAPPAPATASEPVPPAGQGPMAGEGPVNRDALIRALLDRSRLLQDAHFELPLDVYRRYLREVVEGEPLPVSHIVSEGRWHVTLPATGDAKLTATLRLVVFDPVKARAIPLLSEKLVWKDVRLDGQPVKPVVKDGWLCFSPPKAGEVVITAEAVLERKTFLESETTLNVPQTVRTLLEFDGAGAWEIVPHDDPRRIRGDAAGGTHGFTPRDALRFACRPPEVVVDRPPKFQLLGNLAWNLDEGTQQVEAALNVAIVGGSTDRLDLTLPAGAERVSVTGPDVRETRVDGTTVQVFLRQRVTGQTVLTLKYERPRSKDGVERLEGLSIRDGRWTGGTLVVTSTAGTGEVLAGDASGLRERALAGLDPDVLRMLPGPPAVAWDITAPQWSAEVEFLRLGEFALRESIVDLAHYELAFRPDGTMMGKATFEVRNRHRQFLRITLPAGSRVLLARVNETSRPVTSVAGETDTWLVPLVRSQASVEGLVSFP
ncbi:MAG TPA: hypothetical protein VMX57_05350, partial [Planctomycetota bacterium]|nr:hypothetical protein [Planctomycetota bacterium]